MVATESEVLELAELLAPGCPAERLEETAAYFGLEGRNLAARLYERLVALLEQIDSVTLSHVTRLAAPIDWPLKRLFLSLEHQRARSMLEGGVLAAATPIGAWIANGAPDEAGRRQFRLQPDPFPRLLDLEDIAARLAPGAELAQALPDYEPREQQVQLAQLVAETLNDGGQLLAEAGTGVGKGLAYLLPAALMAMRNDWRILISTATTTLQDQLFQKDLLVLRAGLGAEHDALRATVLKGRANYVCLRRWQTLLHAPDLTPDDRRLLIKTLFWLPHTRTGDRAELRLTPGEEIAWQRISAVAEACTPTRCPYHRIGVCFLARARRAAEESHLVITNHALLLSDLVTRSRVLPDYQALIVDEAHHLEDEATSQLGWRLGERELLTRLERLWSPGPSGSVGAVPEALALLAAFQEQSADLQRGEQAVLELVALVRRFFSGLGALLEEADLGAADDPTLRLGGAVRSGSRWQELESIWASAEACVRTVERVATDLRHRLEELGGQPEAAADLAAELAAQLDYWRDVRRRLSTAAHAPGADSVYWVSGGGRLGTPFLNAAPLDVAGLLGDRLFTLPEATVLVSATLAIDNSFDYVKNRLGLPDAREAALGSPFDFRRAALLYVPNDLPDPTQPAFQRVFEQVLLEIVARVGGRTLVLFTSRAHLRATYFGVRDALAAQEITLLGQGINEASRTRLLASFRRGSRVVLFGTNAFWEGIDVIGDALSCVVVARLPFAVPTDPVYSARAEQFEDPFAEYAVPQAVLRLKQGFGRLIRSRSDRGAVVVLDSRLVTRVYGRVFLRSLPPCSVKQGPARRAGAEVATWLADPESLLAAQPVGRRC